MQQAGTLARPPHHHHHPEMPEQTLRGRSVSVACYMFVKYVCIHVIYIYVLYILYI